MHFQTAAQRETISQETTGLPPGDALQSWWTAVPSSQNMLCQLQAWTGDSHPRASRHLRAMTGISVPDFPEILVARVHNLAYTNSGQGNGSSQQASPANMKATCSTPPTHLLWQPVPFQRNVAEKQISTKPTVLELSSLPSKHSSYIKLVFLKLLEVHFHFVKTHKPDSALPNSPKRFIFSWIVAPTLKNHCFLLQNAPCQDSVPFALKFVLFL